MIESWLAVLGITNIKSDDGVLIKGDFLFP